MANTAHKDEREHLKERLIDARNEYPAGSQQFMVPRCDQGKIITMNAIIESIAPPGPARASDLVQSAQTIHTHAKVLFAILALVEKETDIHNLLHEGICDSDLPFERKLVRDKHYSLHRKSGNIVQTCEMWPNIVREKFDREQFWVFSPFFKNMGHYELELKIVLPFRHDARLDMDEYKEKEGGYGVVFPVRLHSSHHSFWPPAKDPNKEPLIAIKRLYSKVKKEFDREVTILKEIAVKKHPHMIQLLATYRHNDVYHLMFPFAQSNLRKYWDDRPNPDFNHATLVWNLKQMSGVANALLKLHNYRITIERGEVDQQDDGLLSVQPGEEKYGRHGDIKPENFLWFKQINGVDDPNGVLQLADFGLGRFHREASRSGSNGGNHSPTYEPPECKLHRKVSREYDFWSLGCVLLEYVTWLLRGAEAVTEFSNSRGAGSNNISDVNDDNYFTIIKDEENEDDAVVRKEVEEWVEDLHAHPNASALIHELLSLTMDQLLVVDSKERVKAGPLYTQLKVLLDRAEENEPFVTEAIPWPKPDRVTPKPTHTRKVGFLDPEPHSQARSFTTP